MQESRLFGILYYLLDKGRATAPELAARFEVSTRTIYRDIDQMSSVGIPVYVTTGRNGGIQFLDDYVLTKSFFNDNEKQEILSGLQSLAAVSTPGQVDTLNKLAAIFQTSLTDWISVDFSHWGGSPEMENALFLNIKHSIFEKRQIDFDYYAQDGTCKRRSVYPLKLSYKDKSWYLSAFCLLRKANRLFRLTRIKKLQVTDNHFDMQSTEPIPTSVPPKPMGEDVHLELLFTEKVGYRLYDTLNDNDIALKEDGYHVTITIPKNEWLYEYLLSFGNNVTILHPDSICNEIIERLEQALNHHKGGKSDT